MRAVGFKSDIGNCVVINSAQVVNICENGGDQCVIAVFGDSESYFIVECLATDAAIMLFDTIDIADSVGKELGLSVYSNEAKP